MTCVSITRSVYISEEIDERLQASNNNFFFVLFFSLFTESPFFFAFDSSEKKQQHWNMSSPGSKGQQRCEEE